MSQIILFGYFPSPPRLAFDVGIDDVDDHQLLLGESSLAELANFATSRDCSSSSRTLCDPIAAFYLDLQINLDRYRSTFLEAPTQVILDAAAGQLRSLLVAPTLSAFGG